MITVCSESQPPQSYSGSLSKKDKLLTITALSGEFPHDRSDRLDIGSDYARILRHRLYQEGLIKSCHSDGLKGLIMTSKGTDILKQKLPERFKYISERSRKEISRRYRLFAGNLLSVRTH